MPNAVSAVYLEL